MKIVTSIIINLPESIASCDKAKQAKERCDNWAFHVVQTKKDLRKLINPDYLANAGFNGTLSDKQRKELSGLLYDHWESIRVKLLADELAPIVNMRFLSSLRQRNIELRGDKALTIFHDSINKIAKKDYE